MHMSAWKSALNKIIDAGECGDDDGNAARYAYPET